MKKLLLFACLLAVLASGCTKSEPQLGCTDVCGNSYKVITIDSQTWMAENLRCNKYDTESEAYKSGLTTIATSKEGVATPYYVDAADKNNWEQQDYAGKLSDAQVSALGYLYNWAAAVGVSDGEKQKSEFSGNRQGVCPNGWHLPSRAEWQTLVTYIEQTQGRGLNSAGQYLKTTSGWYADGNGTDDYGFAALPTGLYNGGKISAVGGFFACWTATPFLEDPKINGYAWDRVTQFDISYLSDNYIKVETGICVRCIKN